ncbi:uncharacterized protein LOC133712584 isoform X2 [Rosa rugosa]|uniref:uncharacterized protein LOC133712584 isoform X2 n=1 Tax=Rosa rugosa TaxID=74645 RepID=UPI002B40F027|nr:uncharacterized protein LOC133712584 isoform X2 [Rosa rugosa]
MVASDAICPTEDAVQAFLDHLVDPILPAKSSLRDTPSLSQQQSVAKQVHAVVLLYNYYHRKQCPKLEVFCFNSFCKLVLDLKPALLAHMKFMKRSGDTELVDQEKQLSVTERTIMEACQISTSLDASMGAPNTEGWPITKVTVLLVDSKKENCYLQFSSNSMTQGVWSVIDKNLEVRDHSSEDTRGLKHVNKNKRVTGKPSRGEPRIDETSCQKLAYSAITEATGISQNDLLVLESHVVFSDSKEKAAACFFIVQCTQSGKGDIQLPIKDVIDSLQGPLVTKNSRGWTVTTVVEYFHVLPYAEILSDWFHRREFSYGLKDSRLGAGNVNVASPKRTETPSKPGICKNQEKSHVIDVVIEDLGSNTKNSEPKSWEQKDSSGCCKIDLAHAFNGTQEMELEESSMVASKKEKNCKKIPSPVQVVSHQDDMHSCIESEKPKTQDKLFHVNCVRIKDIGNNISSSTPQSYKQKDTTVYKNTSPAEASNGPQKLCMDDSSMVPLQNVESCEKISSTIQVVNQQKKITSIRSELNGSVETVNRTSPSLTDRLQISIASKEHILSETALKVLMKKRNELSIKKRNIEDELARCEKDIQTIINGGEDGSAVIVESLIEGCNDGYLRNERTHTLLDEECPPKSVKRKRLSEAILDKQNQCQELDGICCENSWVLPTYCVSLSDGGFQANVTVEGLDFKCSREGDLCSSPSEARESAALQMLVKLRSMAAQAKRLQVRNVKGTNGQME